MRWVFFFFIPLAVLALEVIVNPYDSIDYEAINVYTYNDCECPESEYKPNKLFLDLDI